MTWEVDDREITAYSQGMKKPNTYQGRRFGNWTVLREAPPKEYTRRGKRRVLRRRVYCRCGCPEQVTRTVVLYDLLYGKSTSCGCLAREATAKRSTTHGKSATPIYEAWQHMRARCLNPRVKEWRWYGGRGIKICTRWLRGFQAFYQDMRRTWKPGLSLDRIDGNRGYFPRNCRWATTKQQQRNRRNNRHVYLSGKPMILVEAAEHLKMKKETLRHRLNAHAGATRVRGQMLRDAEPRVEQQEARFYR